MALAVQSEKEIQYSDGINIEMNLILSLFPEANYQLGFIQEHANEFDFSD